MKSSYFLLKREEEFTRQKMIIQIGHIQAMKRKFENSCYFVTASGLARSLHHPIGLFTERKACWEKGKFQDFDTTQLRSSPGFMEAYFRNKTSLLSEHKDVRYLLCISSKSFNFRDYERAICFSIRFLEIFLYSQKETRGSFQNRRIMLRPLRPNATFRHIILLSNEEIN